jgi:hypothetical protein
LDLGHFGVQRGNCAFGFGDNACIALRLAQFNQLGVVGNGLFNFENAIDACLQVLPAAHNVLGLLGIIPEFGVFGLCVQFSEIFLGLVPVKDASSAARWTASCHRPASRFQRALQLLCQKTLGAQ